MSNKDVITPEDIKRKDRYKIIRSMIQGVICLSVAIWFVIYLCFPKQYIDPDQSTWVQRDGFITLSYVGVSNEGNAFLVSKKNLDHQLGALYEAGYVTIGIDDVIAYYKEGKGLPEKALLLIFEDGRKDSMVFATPILEKYNYKAIMMNYASNVVNKDRLFLKGKDLRGLEKNTFWEIGSNGYRFSYINVREKVAELNDKDNDGKYDKNELEYNHYLMDYLRDENGLALESKKEMQERITWDYEEMHSIYEEELGSLPETYMIMHANSLYGNMNDAVEEVNLENIYKYFDVLFNREGSCYNTKEDSLYNLTRMQVGADWSVNKLLLEIKNWTDTKAPFVIGDEEAVSRWQIKGGLMEQKEDQLILTAEANHKAFAYLKGSDVWSDINFLTYLGGREFGTQTIYLRYNSDGSYLKLSVEENKITVEEKSAEDEINVLYMGDMPNADKLPEYHDRFDKNRVEGQTIVPDFNLEDQLDRKYKTNESTMGSPISWLIYVSIEGQKLTLSVGGEVLLDGVEINPSIVKGGIALECFSKDGVIYDGVYDELYIEPILEKRVQ